MIRWLQRYAKTGRDIETSDTGHKGQLIKTAIILPLVHMGPPISYCLCALVKLEGLRGDSDQP